MIAGYTVIRTLGRGGMGTAYLVHTVPAAQSGAEGVGAHARLGDPSFRERFRREVDLASRLDHRTSSTSRTPGRRTTFTWIAMQYVDGPTAAMLRDSDGPLQADAVAGIIAQVASALDYAHAQGLLHRDVKPANVL